MRTEERTNRALLRPRRERRCIRDVVRRTGLAAFIAVAAGVTGGCAVAPTGSSIRFDNPDLPRPSAQGHSWSTVFLASDSALADGGFAPAALDPSVLARRDSSLGVNVDRPELYEPPRDPRDLIRVRVPRRAEQVLILGPARDRPARGRGRR